MKEFVNMQDYVIVMDASGDCDPKVIESENIGFLPMEYTLGDEFRICSTMEPEDIMKQFYNGQRESSLTKTTQITPYKYVEFFSKFMEEGKSVLYLSLSSGLSKTYESSLIAKDELKEKYPDVDLYSIDSLAATGGIGVLVQEAVRNKKAGMSIEENFEKVSEMTHRIYHWFMVDDLNYLRRGGRVSATTAFVGTLLNFKPILKIDKVGKLETIGKERGRKKAYSTLLGYFDQYYDESVTKDVYICHADNLEGAEFLKAELLKKYPSLNVTITYLSPIIGAHTGPDMVSIIHFGK